MARPVKTRIRIQGFLIFCAVVTVLLLSRYLFPLWQNEHWDEALDMLGVLMILFGFLLRVAARGEKKEQSQGGNVLVMSGPYGMIQHPMYTGSFLIGLGIVSILFNAWVLIAMVLVFFGIYVPQLRKEESVLRARFKEVYQDYIQRTPRLFPKVPALFHLREHLFFKWEWLKSEGMSFGFVVLLIITIEVWQDYKSFGSGEFIKEPLELLGLFLAVLILAFFFKKK